MDTLNPGYPAQISPESLIRKRGGVLDSAIQNFYQLMLYEPQYANVRYNELLGSAEVHSVDGKGRPSIRRWSNEDDASSQMFLEAKYGIYSAEKHSQALKLLFKTRSYNPIVDLLDQGTWDGKERCEQFLTEWAKCEDTAYTREVSRLIFAGGINRLLIPGCKFDDVPVLIGKQGTGKSSICQFLSLRNDWFGEVKEVENPQKSAEQLQGKWVCEIAEMAAFTRAKEIESIKAYITRQDDYYRKPYEREPVQMRRRCIFIGTTNLSNPFSDKSGNRRFYPVVVNSDGYELWDKQDECRDYVYQCWLEARKKFEAGEMKPFAKRELVNTYRDMQSNAMQDDWRVGSIKDFLDRQPIGTCVCVRELMHKCLCTEDRIIDPTPKDTRDICEIMSSFDGWNRLIKAVRTKEYGVQKCWRKEFEDPQEIFEPTEDELPM